MKKYRVLTAFTLLLLLTVNAWGQRTTNGELALRALHIAFPDKINEPEFIDDDWTIIAGDQTFFWADGRILPEDEKDKTEEYSSFGFYQYPEVPRSPSTYPPQYIETLRSRGSPESRGERRDNHKGIQGIMYGGITRSDIDKVLVRVEFLGKQITVNQLIAGPLERIEAEIKKWRGGQVFIDSLGHVSAFNWREIAGTQRMSFHSWGIAVDIMPKTLGGRSIYWLWEREKNENWMLIPLNRRWNPPDQVIKAFEQEGFVWGGKWAFFDNMHFEYRPELHEFTRLLAENPEAVSYGGTGLNLHHIFPDSLLQMRN